MCHRPPGRSQSERAADKTFGNVRRVPGYVGILDSAAVVLPLMRRRRNRGAAIGPSIPC